MTKCELSKKAIQDLDNIWEFTFEKWSENQADKYYNMLVESFKQTGYNPGQGKDYSIIMAGLKGVNSGRPIIFYQESDGIKIEIIRILHEKMDLKNRLE